MEAWIKKRAKTKTDRQTHMHAHACTHTQTHTGANTHREKKIITDAYHRAVWTSAIKLISHLGCLACISCCNLGLSLTVPCRLQGSSCLYLIPVRLPLPSPLIESVFSFLAVLGSKCTLCQHSSHPSHIGSSSTSVLESMRQAGNRIILSYQGGN